MEPQQTPGCDTCCKYSSEFCASPVANSCSEWERQYYDQDGNKVSLDKLCRIEPAWAANRLRAELKENRRLTAENARLRGELKRTNEMWADTARHLENADKARKEQAEQNHANMLYLREQIAELTAENARLREQLAAAGTTRGAAGAVGNRRADPAWC